PVSHSEVEQPVSVEVYRCHILRAQAGEERASDPKAAVAIAEEEAYRAVHSSIHHDQVSQTVTVKIPRFRRTAVSSGVKVTCGQEGAVAGAQEDAHAALIGGECALVGRGKVKEAVSVEILDHN